MLENGENDKIHTSMFLIKGTFRKLEVKLI